MTESDKEKKVTGRELRVMAGDDGIRLNRWCKQYVSEMPFGLMQKLLRKGAIRVNGVRATADQRLRGGQVVRIPILEKRESTTQEDGDKKRALSEEKLKNAAHKWLEDTVIYENNYLVVINKPHGLASQGGSKVKLSVDVLMPYIAHMDGGNTPRLVHRLDKDTSGVMLLGKTGAATRELTEVFRERDVKKIYWAIIKGVPRERQGKINLPLALRSEGGREEKVRVDEAGGKKSTTFYKVIETAGNKLSWVMLMPHTGRKHQLRVHMDAIGHPIVGDGKYGGAEAFITGVEQKLHLHARRVVCPSVQVKGKQLDVCAPLPPHMQKTWELFDFNASHEDDVELL